MCVFWYVKSKELFLWVKKHFSISKTPHKSMHYLLFYTVAYPKHVRTSKNDLCKKRQTFFLLFIFYLYPQSLIALSMFYWGLPWWLSGKESACQCRRRGFDPWGRKVPWRRKWQLPPVFLPGKPHGQRSLAGLHNSPWSQKEVRNNWVTRQQHPFVKSCDRRLRNMVT